MRTKPSRHEKSHRFKTYFDYTNQICVQIEFSYQFLQVLIELYCLYIFWHIHNVYMHFHTHPFVNITVNKIDT